LAGGGESVVSAIRASSRKVTRQTTHEVSSVFCKNAASLSATSATQLRLSCLHMYRETKNNHKTAGMPQQIFVVS